MTHDEHVQETPHDFRVHAKTYYGFLHLMKYFALHAMFLLVGLYFIVFGDASFFGSLLLLVAVVVLGWGVVSTPAAANAAADRSKHRIEAGQPDTEARLAGDNG